jgi:hypothetical protein
VRWRCRACGCLYTPGVPCCPACRATVHDDEAAPAAGEEDEVAKIDRFSAVSVAGVTTVHASAILPDGAQVHPGFGTPPQGIEHPADGTMSPPVSNDPAEPPATVTVADQKAAGVAPQDTVTVAEQKAGTPPPVPPAAPAKPASAVPPKRKATS